MHIARPILNFLLNCPRGSKVYDIVEHLSKTYPNGDAWNVRVRNCLKELSKTGRAYFVRDRLEKVNYWYAKNGD